MTKPAHQARTASDRVARVSPHSSLWTIFRWPLVISVLSLIGLIGALLEDGVWDWLGAALIAGSVGAVAWARLRSSRS